MKGRETSAVMEGAGDFVCPLERVGQDDVALVGGKAANLGELMRLGIRVPRGFVVTGEGFLHARRGGDRRAAVKRRVAETYEDLGLAKVAVRSSATVEDLQGAASAGQYDTFLDVCGEGAVVAAVDRCWGSLAAARAVGYRAQRGVDDAQAKMAVVVQEMVPAEVAGVVFTADPVTGDRTDVVVHATKGLGEPLVSGEVTGEHLTVDVRKQPIAAGAAGGRHLEGVFGAMGWEALEELVTTALAIQEHFGSPQDIEWAYADDTVWFLQARPITSLPPAPLKMNRFVRAYTATIAEMLPVRPYPLDMTTWTTRGPGQILRRMADDLGGVRVELGDTLPETGGVVDWLRPVRPSVTRRVALASLRTVIRALRYRCADWTEDEGFHRYEHTVGVLEGEDPHHLTWPALLARVERVFATLDAFAAVRVRYLPGAALDLIQLRVCLIVLGLARFHSTLTRGVHTRTSEANDALRTLGQILPADTDTELTAAQFDALRAYLDEYGHREAVSGLLASQPTWGEETAFVRATAVALAAAAIDDGPPPDPSAQIPQRRRVRFLGLAGLVRALIADARSAVAFREDTHFHAMRLLPIVRGTLLEMGRRLEAADVITDAADIWHLRWDELTAITTPEQATPDNRAALRTTIADRVQRRLGHGGAPLISPASLRGPASESGETALITGAPAGVGRAIGPVRIVSGPQDFGRLRPGDVLVCPYTNPTWTTLFHIAAAVVVDTGSVGSHAAITAREYGIPAVMGTIDGTTTLTEGSFVEVDGTTGHVYAAAALPPRG